MTWRSWTIKPHDYLVDCTAIPLDNSANDVNLNCSWILIPLPMSNRHRSSDSRLAPAVSCSGQIRSSSSLFNSGVNRANHANSCPNEIGKAEEFLLLIFWISSCVLCSPSWSMHNLLNWTRSFSSLVPCIVYAICESEGREVQTLFMDGSFFNSKHIQLVSISGSQSIHAPWLLPLYLVEASFIWL